MLSFQLNSGLLNKIRYLQKLFIEKYHTLCALSADEQEMLHRLARISVVGASTRIENAVLTDLEIDWLDTLLIKDSKTTAFQKHKAMISDKLSKERERSIEEVIGCRTMLMIIYEQAQSLVPLTETSIRGLHHELLRHYPKATRYVGRYKTNSNSVVSFNKITQSKKTVLETAAPGIQTQTQMFELIKWYNQAYENEPFTLPLACEFVFRFLAIHPFQDGNGRLGRGLFLLLLLQSQDISLAYVSRFLAIDRHIEQHKEEYYWVLHRCSNGKFSVNPKKYHVENFFNFMIKVLIESLNDIEINHKKYHVLRSLSTSAQAVLQCFKEKPESRLQTNQICSLIKIPRRTVINSLNTLLKHGLIQRYGQGAGSRYQLIF